jgi:5-aminopentanamidase
MTRVACAQLAPRVGDLPGNADLSTAAIARCVAAGADVVVLPELVTSGYVFASPDEARSVAITPEHPVFSRWAAELPPGTIVAGGFCERGDDGLLYNSAAVVDATGVRAVYRKAHLWDREKLFFAPGGEHPPVVETVHGRIGVLVCYDLEFPEWTRTVALAGADLIVVPTNWPLVGRPAGERPPEVVIAMAAARVNRVAIACCDRAGTERGQEWTRGTTVIDAAGWVLAATQEEAEVVVELDLLASRDKTLTEHAHLLHDRRPELYGAVAARR